MFVVSFVICCSSPQHGRVDFNEGLAFRLPTESEPFSDFQRGALILIWWAR